MPDLKQKLNQINQQYQLAAWRILQAITPRQQAKYAFVASAALALATAVDPTIAQTIHPALTGTAALLGSEAWGKLLGDIANDNSLTDEAILDRLQQLLPPDHADDILNNQAEILQQITKWEAWESLLVTIKENDELLAQRLTDELNIVNQKLDYISANMATRQQVEELRQTLTQPKPTIPLQLPPRATHFTGRQEELTQLLNALQPGQIVTLVGPGGIGKTALAAEAVAKLINNNQPPASFPDGVIFYTFYGRPSLLQAAVEIVRQFGDDPNPDPLLAASRSLGRRTALLVLDGAEQVKEGQLTDLLNIRSNCAVLLTSHNREDIYDIEITVFPLPVENSITLLQAWGKQWAADEAVAHTICELVGNLALAVRLVGAYLHKRNEFAAEYLEWLRTSPLQALDFGERRDKSIPILLEKSVAQLSPTAQSALALFGCLALAPLEIAPIAAALDLDEQQTRKALGELTRFSLLSRSTQGYELTHSLLRTFARERLAVNNEQIEQLGKYFTELALHESNRGLKGYKVLDKVRLHIIALLEELQEAEQWETANDLAWKLSSQGAYLDIQGHWLDRIAVSKIGLTAAQALDKEYDQGVHLTHLGNSHLSLGNVEEAIKFYQKALENHRKTLDRRGEGIALGNLGGAYRKLGYLDQAIKFYNQSLTISREIGDRRGEGSRLSSLGDIFRDLKQFDRAMDVYQQAYAISREIDDLRGQGNRLGKLGIAYLDLGQSQLATENIQEALKVSSKIGDRYGAGFHWFNLGVVYENIGSSGLAAAHYQQALTIFEEINSPYAEQARQALANLHSATDE